MMELLYRHCPIKGCTNCGAYVVSYTFKAKGYPDGSPRVSMLFPFLICEEHKDEVKVEHIVTDASWGNVEQSMARINAAPPDRASVRLELTPIEHTPLYRLSHLLDLQAQQALINLPPVGPIQ